MTTLPMQHVMTFFHFISTSVYDEATAHSLELSELLHKNIIEEAERMMICWRETPASVTWFRSAFNFRALNKVLLDN